MVSHAHHPAKGFLKMARRTSKLTGVLLSAVLVMTVVASFALAVPVYAVSMHPLELPNQHHRQDVRIPKGTEFTITGSGTAINITNASDHRSASLSLLVKVVKDSFGRARLKVESGTLTVGSQTFTVDGGNG